MGIDYTQEELEEIIKYNDNEIKEIIFEIESLKSSLAIAEGRKEKYQMKLKHLKQKEH